MILHHHRAAAPANSETDETHNTFSTRASVLQPAKALLQYLASHRNSRVKYEGESPQETEQFPREGSSIVRPHAVSFNLAFASASLPQKPKR